MQGANGLGGDAGGGGSSGGGGLANFSWGVARALLDEGLLPSLICGTSAGAVVAAALCCHTERELDSLYDGERGRRSRRR